MVQRCIAECRHGVTLESLYPACDVPGVAPTGYVRLMDDFPERRHWRSMLLGQRIATFRDRGPVVQRLLANSGEAYGRKSAQADIATESVDGAPLDPGLASRLADVQVQASAVGVLPRFLECPDTSRR